MAVQRYVIPLNQSRKQLRGKVTVSLIDLMEVIDSMRRTRFDTNSLCFRVTCRACGRPGKASHQARCHPAQEMAGVHGGSATLILELLGHVGVPLFMVERTNLQSAS